MHAYVSNATSRSRTSRLASTAERGKQGLDVVNESEATWNGTSSKADE